MKINIGALLTVDSKADKALKETKALGENLKYANAQSELLAKTMGKTGSNAAKKAGAFNDRDGISTKENRGAKGVSGQRGAAGRDMAGLRDASDSTSGIVAAYATAAANMFAITAAFKALSDAAKVQQLREGLELVGAQSGVTLGLVSKNLEKVTGYGISAAEAMKSVASATAAGFSGKEIERLGTVARGAAVALGRDMSDAMDRLTRGSIKLEPELLDELGIMTRIDDAVRAYADAHDKAKSSLTQTERRQAFLNAVLEEGESKFGSIAESVPISAFDKLNASMKNMATGGIGELVKFLNPLVELLTQMPALIMLPMAGLLTSVANKLIPGANAQLEKFERKAMAAGKAVQNSLKYKNIRIDQMDYTIDAARDRARDRLGIAVGAEDDRKIGTLKAERALVLEKIAKERELLALAIKQNNVAEERIRLNNIAAGKAAVAAYSSGINLTEKNQRSEAAVAKKGFSFNMQALSAQQFERTQIELAAREGDVKGQAIAGLKGVRAQFASIIPTVLTYRSALIAANIEAGKGTPILLGVRTAWAAATASAFAFGVTAKLAIQGLVAAIPIIGWILTAITIAASAWDFFKSEKDKAMEGLKEQLKEILKTVDKVNEEIDRFREKGQYGRAFEAEIGNLSEVYNKLKEIVYLKDKVEKPKTTTTKLIGWTAGQLAGGDEDTKKALSSTFDRIASFKGTDFTMKLAHNMRIAKENGQDWLALMQPTVDGADAISKSWTDISEAVKSGGQAIRKFWGDDFFKTDYTEIANTFRTITTELKAQDQYITDPIAKTQAASDVISKFVAGGKDMFLEMDRVYGTGSSKFVDEFTELAAAQAEITTLTKVGDEKSLATAKELTAQLAIRQEKFKNLIEASGVLQKIATEEFKIKLATINLEAAKSAVVLQELRNTARTVNNSIAASKQAIERMKIAQGFDILQGYDKVDAIKNAQVEYNNAKDIASLKNSVIDREFELAALQKELMLQKARLELTDAESQFTQKYYKDGRLNSTATINSDDSVNAGYLADTLSLNIRRQIVTLYEKVETTSSAINTAQKDANDRDVAAKAQALALAKETFRTSLNNLKKTQDITTATLDLELKIAAAKRQSFMNSAELQRTKQINDAARTAFGSLDQLGELRQAKDKAILDQWKTIFDELDRRKREQNNIDNLRGSMNAATEMRDNYVKNNAATELVDNANDVLATRTREYDAAVLAQTTSGLAAADAIAAHAEALRNATNLITDINNVPGWLDKKLDRAGQDRTRANASVGMNMVGAGEEFRGLLDERWGQVGQSVYGGDFKKFLEKEDIALMKQAAQQMKELSIVTEGITSVTSAFHSELSAAFSSIIDGSKDAGEAFGDMALSMLKMIADLISQLIAMQLIKAAAGIPGLGFLGAGAAGGVMPMANGGIMSRSAGGLQGVINKPTYLVGEGRYNEAVVPLPNGRAIPVQMHGNNTSSNSVQVNINMTQTGETKTDSKGPDMNNLGAAVAAAVQKELQAQKAPGGILSRYGVA